jgi:hypothetical protein
MKRSLLVLIILAFVAAGLCADGSAYYPVRVDVVKVYAHSDGFRIVYRIGTMSFSEVYLPIGWFVPGGKAELVRSNDPSNPYMSVFYKDGKFDHLRLYVQANMRDLSWGILEPSAGAGKFDPQADLKLQY